MAYICVVNILILIVFFVRFSTPQNIPDNQFYQLTQILQNGLSSLNSKINDKFLQLNSQLSETNRKVSKTLSIFENEWNYKAERLKELEAKQTQVEKSINQLNKMYVNLEKKLNQSGRTETQPSSSATNFPIYQTITQAPHPPRRQKNTGRPISAPGSMYPFLTKNPQQKFPATVPKNTTFGVQIITGSSIIPTNTSKAYFLFGSPKNFINFSPIPTKLQPSLTSIELQYVNIIPQHLVDSVKNATNLMTLKLLSIKLFGQFDAFQRAPILLPNLQNYIFHQIGQFTFSEDSIFSKWSEIDDYLKDLNDENMEQIIFFEKNTTNPLALHTITNTDLNLQIIIDGIQILYVNHETGEINSMLKGITAISSETAENFQLKKLALSTWRIDLASIPRTIESLNANYVLNTVHPVEDLELLNAQLQEFVYLKDLNIFVGNQGQNPRPGFLSSNTIGTLILKNLTIRYSDISTFPKDHLLRLDNLNLYYCEFDMEFIDNFASIFESINIYISFRNNSITENGLHYTLLENILLNTPTRRILIQNFYRIEAQLNWSGELIQTYTSIETFLQYCGVAESQRDFLLFQNSGGEWYGVNLDYEELARETFSLVGTDKFVTFDAFRRIVS